VDFARKEFESRLRWLESKGVKVQRYTMPRDASWSSINPTVKSAVEAQGADCLPIVMVARASSAWPATLVPLN
jgi:hypothetical protein